MADSAPKETILTPQQHKLLMDLAALQDGGYIFQHETIVGRSSFEDGSEPEVEVPGTLTQKGWDLVKRNETETTG